MIVRVHSVAFGPLEFNPGKGMGGGRFDPLYDSHSKPVPTLYGASDFTAALSETLFRDAADHGSVITHPRLAGLARSTLRVQREMLLVSLYDRGLQSLHIPYAALLGSSASAYARTRASAHAVCDTTAATKNVVGMLYPPPSRATHDAVVLWGDRLSRSDLEVVEGPASLARADLYTRILAVAADLGFVVAAR
ncbi:MAG: RES family NAD+ phosphorylase [Nitrococcus sp.]|nr:RES family NAD+ phosphorylase [Nitrococcus sp.]